ncbi:MAG: DUF721 domain-containing protein, partial [Myxococcales bacterium]|nr:DUF721 domain-containing protein [Myxococcales bacterium]
MKFGGTYWLRAKSARRRPHSAGEILERVFVDLKIAERMGDYEVWNVWEEVVGPQVARVTKPRSLSKGTLTVLVASAAWHHTLHHEREGLITRLNNRLGRRVVQDIRFREGMTPAPAPVAAPEASAPRALSTAEKARVAAEIDGIEDEDLRAAIAAASAARLRG